MQEVYHDGTKGKPKSAETLEELLPDIKKALEDPRVNHVKLFIPGRQRKQRK